MACNCDPLLLVGGLLAVLGLLAGAFIILGLIADHLLPHRDIPHD